MIKVKKTDTSNFDIDCESHSSWWLNQGGE